MAGRELPGPELMALDLSMVDAMAPAPRGPVVWREYMANVRALRRWYARQVTFLGTTAGLFITSHGFVADTVGEDFWWLLVAVGLFLYTVPQWGKIVRAGVAPFVRRPRHTLPYLAFVAAFAGGLAAPYVWQPGLRTGLVFGAAAALAGAVAAALELAQPVPDYPAEWLAFSRPSG